MALGRFCFTFAALAFLSGCTTTISPGVSSRSSETAVTSSERAESTESDFVAGLAGFTAPSGVDFVAFGHAVLGGSNGESIGDRFTRLARGEQQLSIDIPIEMECWRYDSAEGFTEEMLKRCASPAALDSFIKRNREVLARYERLRGLAGPPRMEIGKSGSLMNDAAWVSIDVADTLQKNQPEEAFRKWRANQLFVTRLANGPNHWIEKAIALVNEGGSLETLQVLLRRAPKTIEAHRDEILALIRPGDFSRYGLEEVFRDDEAMMPAYAKELGISDVMIERLRPRHSAYLADISAALKNPGMSIKQTIREVRERHAASMPAGASDSEFEDGWQKILRASHISLELLNSMQHKEARRRLFTLRLLMDKAGVSDEGVVAYLQSAPAELRSPYDSSPAEFDRVRRKITFVVPGQKPEQDYLAVPFGESR